MKKRIIALFLMLSVLLSLAGCGKMPCSSAPAAELTGPDGYPMYQQEVFFSPRVYPAYHEGDYMLTVQYLPETVENTQDLPVLKILYLCQERFAYLEEPVIEANRMLAELGAPYRLQLVIVRYAPPEGADAFDIDFLALPQVQQLLPQADLVCGVFRAEDRAAYLSPITEYVTGNAQPSLQGAVPHDREWDCVTENGQVYGIPAGSVDPVCQGWQVDADFMQKCGLTVADFQKEFWEMDEVFAGIYEANGAEPFLTPYFAMVETGNLSAYKIQTFSTFSFATLARYQCVFADFALDLRSGMPKAICMPEDGDFRKIQEAILRYQDAGYVEKLSPEGENEGIRVFYRMLRTSEPCVSGEGDMLIPVTPLVYEGSKADRKLLGITKGSRQREQAVAFLQLMAQEESFRMQLCFGKEGQAYADGTGYDLSGLFPLSRFDPPAVAADLSYPARDGMSALETYRKDMDRVAWIFCPVTLDYSAFEEDLAAYKRVMDQYYPLLTSREDRIYEASNASKYWIPRFDSALYDRMLLELKAAGSDRIKAALQAQADAWLEDHPGWTAQQGNGEWIGDR